MQNIEKAAAAAPRSDDTIQTPVLAAKQPFGPRMQRPVTNVDLLCSIPDFTASKFSGVFAGNAIAAPLTGEQVWKALEADPRFVEKIGDQSDLLALFKAIAEKSPEVLKDLLEQKGGLKNILTAKVDLFRYTLASGLLDKMPPDLGEALKEMFLTMVMQLEQVIANLDEILKERGMTERDVLARLLSAQNLASFDKGELTVCNLVLSQPWLIFGNELDA